MEGLKVIPSSQLFVSEPNPSMFGNAQNPRDATAHGWSNSNWLKSRFHFSFAEYSNGPSNFGCLRVMNDDLVQPERGFGTHPHQNMEIITFVVQGELSHKDSMGTEESLGRGSIQFMTAGTGVRHSEHNLKKVPLRFIQSWVTPRKMGLKPNYGSMSCGAAESAARKNKWAHLVSDVDNTVQTPVKINQDCNVFVVELSTGSASPPLAIGASRQAYMLCIEGEVTTGDQQSLRQHDAAEVRGPMTLELLAGAGQAMVMVFEMARAGGSQR